MDLNFGEILEPVSRAFYDDYDDETLNLPFKQPYWKWKNEDGKECFPENVAHLVIVEGLQALDVINPTILKNKAPICEVDGHKVEVFNLPNCTICVSEEKDLNYFASITELLKPWIELAEKCSIISLQSLSDFKTDELPESCTIRSINSEFTDIPSLEVPNFITGVAAGVGSLRKLMSLSFSCYIVYIDLYDVFSIRTILDQLKRIGVAYDKSINLRPLHHKSDLYM